MPRRRTSPPRPPRDQESPSGIELLGLGVGLAVAVVVPLALGLLADSRFRSAPAGVVIGLILGIVVSSWTVYQRFKHYW